MTVADMHNEFKLLLDKGDSGDAPSFLDSEIDTFLNMAIAKFITQRMYGGNRKRTGFEEDAKRRDDLRNLITNKRIIPLADEFSVGDGSLPNGNFATLPENYRHMLSEFIIAQHPSFTGLTQSNNYLSENEVGDDRKIISVTALTYDRYNKIINDPFNKPDLNTVYRLGYKGTTTGEGGGFQQVELIHHPDVTLLEYNIRYIRAAQSVSLSGGQDSDLAKHTHREIVRMAVLDALENVEQPRYQTSKIELNEIE